MVSLWSSPSYKREFIRELIDSPVWRWGRIPPLAREGAPEKQDRNCQSVINIWSRAPDAAQHQDLLIDWPSVAM
jgi:hypothetical protein